MNLNSVVSYVLLSSALDKISLCDKKKKWFRGSSTQCSKKRVQLLAPTFSFPCITSIFLPKAMIKKSCNNSKPAATLTSPSKVQGTMAEAAAYMSNAWKGSDPFEVRLPREVCINEPILCSPKHSRSSLALQATVGRRSTPLPTIFTRKDAEELAEKAASRDATFGCPGKQVKLRGGGTMKGCLLGMPLYSPTLHHTGCCVHFCLCWPFSQKVNLCIALYVLTWCPGDLLRENTDMKKTFKWMLVPLLLYSWSFQKGFLNMYLTPF